MTPTLRKQLEEFAAEHGLTEEEMREKWERVRQEMIRDLETLGAGEKVGDDAALSRFRSSATGRAFCDAIAKMREEGTL